jgi:hypothetical protein
MTGNREIVRIDFEHHAIHEGEMFQAWVIDESMADNDTINLAFKTPASTTKQIHMFIDIDTKVGCQLEVLEAATWTAQTGTVFVPINVDRNSSNTSTMTGNETTTTFTANEIAYGVTTILTTNATEIARMDVFGSKKGGGNNRSATELILKSATTYVVRMTAEGGSNMGAIRIRWYEYLPNTI